VQAGSGDFIFFAELELHAAFALVDDVETG
jgi:hypothetical protein